MKQQTILIVDDEASIRELMQLFLQDKGYRVLSTSDGGQAIRVVETESPDLILLDIEMPGETGFEVCRKIREKLTVPIIFLSVRREVMDKVKCFELGGDDYLTKPFDLNELEARIMANLRRYKTNGLIRTEPNNVLKYEELEIDLDGYQCYLKGDRVELAAKEMQLLIYLASHPNQVWSAEQLYDQIWEMDSTGNIQTIKVHISNLRRKIEKDPANPKYIQTVRGFGYQFTPK